jgi:hypothetical protein
MPDNMASFSSFNRLQLASFRTESPSLGSALSCMAIVNDMPQKELRPLSLCQVIVIDSILGAPAGCILLAASQHSRQWLLANIGSFSVLLADNGKPDFSFNLFYAKGSPALELVASGKTTIEQVLTAADAAIHKDPLRLQTRVTSHVLGVAGRRESPVLAGTNEEVTVRIDVDSSAKSDSGGQVITRDFTLEVSTSILINEHKDPNLKSWHKPSQEQTRSWSEAIRKRLSEELSSLCPQSTRKDDFTLVCK